MGGKIKMDNFKTKLDNWITREPEFLEDGDEEE